MSKNHAYNIAEVCAAGKFGRTSAFRFIKSGALKAKKIGSRTVVLEADLQQFLESLPPAAPKSKS
jgi:hypothetical protein